MTHVMILPIVLSLFEDATNTTGLLVIPSRLARPYRADANLFRTL